MTKVICDKCGKAAKGSILIQDEPMAKAVMVDLCKDCLLAVKALFNKEPFFPYKDYLEAVKEK